MVIIHSSCLLIDRSELRSLGDMQASRSAAQGNKIPAEPAVRRLSSSLSSKLSSTVLNQRSTSLFSWLGGRSEGEYGVVRQVAESQIVHGRFSALWTPIAATEASSESSRRDLPNARCRCFPSLFSRTVLEPTNQNFV